MTLTQREAKALGLLRRSLMHEDSTVPMRIVSRMLAKGLLSARDVEREASLELGIQPPMLKSADGRYFLARADDPEMCGYRYWGFGPGPARNEV